MVWEKEADEKWASSQHVYVAYTMAGTLSAAGGAYLHRVDWKR